MPAGYLVSPETKTRIEAMLALNPGGTVGVQRGSATRQVCHVKVTGPMSGLYYPCLATGYDPIEDMWVEFGEALVLDPNDNPLVTDDYYLAIRYGKNGDDSWVFATTDGTPLLGCGLVAGEDEEGNRTTDVDLEAFAGDGLELDEDSDSGACDALKVKAGCGILVSSDGVSIDLDAVAGCGLKVDEDSDSGCAKLAVDVDALAGTGLEVDEDSDSGTCDKFKVKAGCGIVVDGDGVSLDLEAIAGAGLTVDYVDGCPRLMVDTVASSTSHDDSSGGGGGGGGGGIGGGFSFSTDTIEGALDSCGFTISRRTYTIVTNSVGVFVGWEVSEPEYLTLPLPGCCDCDDSSSSSNYDPCSLTDDFSVTFSDAMGASVYTNLDGITKTLVHSGGSYTDCVSLDPVSAANSWQDTFGLDELGYQAVVTCDDTYITFSLVLCGPGCYATASILKSSLTSSPIVFSGLTWSPGCAYTGSITATVTT